jgi:hypothetical protein
MANEVEFSARKYQDVAASQTGVALGSTGVGAVIDGVLVVPETTGAGTIALLDGATSVNIFVTGTLPSLVPFYIPLGSARSVNGGWKITTGANVHIRAFGNF